MTVYNGMYRCPGGQHPPLRRRGWKGKCQVCGRWLMCYPNGNIVMHKRKREVR